MAPLGPPRMEERRLFELQLWALSQSISTWLIDLGPYEPCRVAGVVDRLVIAPQAGVIEVSISDGTGTLTAEWAIRRPTPELAITPGKGVVLAGVATPGSDGQVVIREPSYEIVPFPEVA